MHEVQHAVVFDKYEKVSIREFEAELLYDFTELPSDAVAHYVLRAINTIATKGNILRRTALIHTQDCVENYILEPPDCMDIVAVMSICQICGSRCGQVQRLTSEPCRLSCGSVTWFDPPNIIYLNKPRDRNTYKVVMSVAPTYETCEVDRILLTRHYDLVMSGAKYYLYMMPDKPWSSMDRAASSRELFERGISAAAVDTMMGGQRGVLTVKRPRHL